MSGDLNPKPTSKELAKRFSEASPAEQAELIMEMLDGDGLREVLERREWTSTGNNIADHGSGWPKTQGERGTESTWQGRTT